MNNQEEKLQKAMELMSDLEISYEIVVGSGILAGAKISIYDLYDIFMDTEKREKLINKLKSKSL